MSSRLFSNLSLRFFPFGTTLYLVGGLLSGLGMGLSATQISLVSVVMTGIGALFIFVGYVVLRPVLLEAKSQVKALKVANGMDIVK